MTDERFERDLTAVLRDIAGDEAPISLRYRLRTITAAPTVGRRSWFAPLVQLSAAAVVVVAVAALGWTFLRPAIVGMTATPTPGPSSSAPVPSESPSPSQVPSESPSGTPLPSGWTGLDWSDPVVPPAPVGLRIGDIVPWAGGYVAVGDTRVADTETMQGAFMTSTNGLDWTVVQTVDLRRLGERMTHVFVVGGRLLAIADGGGVSCPPDTTCPTPDFSPELWTSVDGSHWTAVDSPTWHAAWSNAGTARWIVAGDAGIIAIGTEGQGVREAGQPVPPTILVVFHSDDGMTWEQADLTQGFDQAVFMDAAAFSGGFVIVGRDGEPNKGTEDPDPSFPIPLGVGRPAAWVSSDGITWTTAQVDGIEIEGGELSQVEAGADGLFAIGAGSPSAGDATPSGWSSADGRTWHVVGRLASDLPAIDQAPLPGSTVLTSDGRHIVVLDREAPGSDTLAAWVSSDGATWIRLALTGSTPLPKIGDYGASGAQGMYVTGATVLPDRIVVTGYGDGAYALWLATAVGS
jgi:hypothetical protein